MCVHSQRLIVGFLSQIGVVPVSWDSNQRKLGNLPLEFANSPKKSIKYMFQRSAETEALLINIL
jgi:hypothetical protein